MIEILKALEFEPFLLSFKLAGITTLILFVISMPLGWWLSQTKSKFKPFFEAFDSFTYCITTFCLGFILLMGIII